SASTRSDGSWDRARTGGTQGQCACGHDSLARRSLARSDTRIVTARGDRTDDPWRQGRGVLTTYPVAGNESSAAWLDGQRQALVVQGFTRRPPIQVSLRLGQLRSPRSNTRVAVAPVVSTQRLSPRPTSSCA